MRCPQCHSIDDKVLDSRMARDGTTIRRRRECLKCSARFTTYEELYREKLRIRKRNGEYEEFERHKLLSGIEKACEKRPVSTGQVEAITDKIITELTGEGDREITSEHIGDLVMEHLQKLDEVAYVRFASVYRQFCDADQFIQEIKNLSRKQLVAKKHNGKPARRPVLKKTKKPKKK